MRSLLTACAALLFFTSGSAAERHGAGWFESGDVMLRNDLLLLNDAGVIRLPVGQWPMPRYRVGTRHLRVNGHLWVR